MKSRSPGSAQWRSSKTITTVPRGREPLEERAPGGEELRRVDRAGVDPEEREEGRLDPAALGLVGDVGRDGLRDLRPGRALVVGLDEAGPAADHLAERPERDPLAICRAPTLVPPDRLNKAVEVLLEFPGQAGLADPADPGDRHEPGPPLPPGRMEEVLEQAQLVVAADEGGLERLRPPVTADAGRRRAGRARTGPGRSCP